MTSRADATGRRKDEEMVMRARVIALLISMLPFVEPPQARAEQARPRTRTVDCSAITESFKVCPTYSVGTVTLVRQFEHHALPP